MGDMVVERLAAAPEANVPSDMSKASAEIDASAGYVETVDMASTDVEWS